MLTLNKNWSSLIKPSKITYDGKNDDNNIANIIIEYLTEVLPFFKVVLQ